MVSKGLMSIKLGMVPDHEGKRVKEEIQLSNES